MKIFTHGIAWKVFIITMLSSYIQAHEDEITKPIDGQHEENNKNDVGCMEKYDCYLRLEKCGTSFHACKSAYNKRIEFYETLEDEYNMIVYDDYCNTRLSECNIENRECNNDIYKCNKNIKYMDKKLQKCNKEKDECIYILENTSHEIDNYNNTSCYYLFHQCEHENYELKCKLRECQRKHPCGKKRKYWSKKKTCRRHCHKKICTLQLPENKFCKLHKCLSPTKNWSEIITDMTEREIYLYNAHLSEIAGLYEDMVSWMNRIACLNVDLTDEELEYLWRAYKNYTGEIYNQYVKIRQIEKEESNGILKIESPLNASLRLDIIRAYKDKIGMELKHSCLDLLCILDRNPVPNNATSATTGLYLLMRGFCESFLADLEVGEKRLAALEKASYFFFTSWNYIVIKLKAEDPTNQLLNDYLTVSSVFTNIVYS